MTLPLHGRRVLVTRAAHQAGKLSSALRSLGLEPVEVPVLEIQPPETFAALDAALRTIAGVNSKSDVILSERSESKDLHLGSLAASPANDVGCPIHPQVAPATGGWVGHHEPRSTGLTYDWLILTSANTVRALADRATTLSFALANYSGQVAAIGEATAAAAREAGLTVSLVPETYVAESLVQTLFQGQHEVSGHDFSRAILKGKNEWALAPSGSFRGQRILLARAAVARDAVPDALRAAGATVDVVDAYRNAIPDSAPRRLRAALEQGIDAATFTSSSSVTHLAAVAKQANIAFPFAGIAAISIGPITTQTLIEHNWPPAAEANPSDIPGLASAVAKLLS